MTPNFHFKWVDAEQRTLVHSWLKEPHVTLWFYGQGLENTFRHLDEFIQGVSLSQYWIAYENTHPFAFFITSSISESDNLLNQWGIQKGATITLDMLIGNTNYLGKGLSPLLIKQFLSKQFPQVTNVLIDPEATNLRAIHVYKKVGFTLLGEFISSHSPNPHYMMHLNMKELL